MNLLTDTIVIGGPVAAGRGGSGFTTVRTGGAFEGAGRGKFLGEGFATTWGRGAETLTVGCGG